MRTDIVIVGAGSAGCVLAGRLSEDPEISVLLLEAGRPDKKLEIRIPAAFSKLFKTSYDWAYETAPQEHAGGRRMYWPRGRVLGGSSSINAMIYIRGHRGTYDAWAREGCEGWGYDDLLPIFKRSENYEEGAGGYHGVGGPLNVAPPVDPNPLAHRFLEAASALGLPRNEDFNGAVQEGVGFYRLTQKGAKRHSAADAFLKPSLYRPNLKVLTGARVIRVLVENGRAVGVEYLHEGSTKIVSAGQVIASGGAVASPQLLLLSGIGPPADLEALGIPVTADLPGVGENLQDHLMLALNYGCRKKITLSGAESLGSLLRYVFFKKGLLTSNVAECGGFLSLDSGAEVPDLQFHFAPGFYKNHGFDNPQGHGFGIAPTLVQPASRGRLTLASKNPLEPPVIDPRYLTDPRDLEVLCRGARRGQEIVESAPFDELRGTAYFPADGIRDDPQALEEMIRTEAETLYHPVGTCRMGTDSRAVVDPRLRVHGIEGLRVVDASIMPSIVNGNTNAPTILIGEMGADFVRGG